MFCFVLFVCFPCGAKNEFRASCMLGKDYTASIQSHNVLLKSKDYVCWGFVSPRFHNTVPFDSTQNAMAMIEDVVIQNVTPRSLTHPFALFPCPHREKIQFIRTEGTPGLVRLSSDADLVMLLR